MNTPRLLFASPVRAGLLWFFALLAAAAPWLLFPGRWPVLTVLAVLALSAAFVALRHQGLLLPTAFDLPLLIYLGLSVVALLASPLPADSLRRVSTLLLGLFAYKGLVSYLAQQGDARAVGAAVRALPFLGAAVALAGLLTVRWPSRYFLDLAFVTERLPHLGGSLEIHHNPLSGVLVLLLLPAFFAGAPRRARRAQAVHAAAMLLVLAVLVLTQSRNGLLSLGAGLVGGWLWQRGRIRLLLVVVALLMLAPPLLGSAPSQLQEPLRRSLDWLDGESKLGPATDQSWLARLEMWRAALHLMRDYPVLGAGLFQFEQVSRANEVYEAIRPDLDFTHAHNLWLQSGAGLGWPGLLAAALLWLAVLCQLGRATASAPPESRWPGVALGASLCSYLTFNTFDVLAPEQRAGLLVWLLLAPAAVFIGRALPGSPVEWRREFYLAPLLLLVLLLPWLPRNLAHLQLDRVRLADGDVSRLVPETMGDARREGLVYYLRGDAGAARTRWAQDPEAAVFLLGQGQQAHVRGQLAAAISWYDEGAAVDPAAAAVYYWRGFAYEGQGEDEKALADYRRAVALAQGEKLYDVSLEAVAWEAQGRLLVGQHAWEAAREAFARAVTLEPDVDDYEQQLADVERMLVQLRDTGNE